MLTVFFITFALVLASTLADPKLDHIELGSCSGFALKAATRIGFDGGLTTVHTGDIGVSPGSGLTGSYKVAEGDISINSKKDTDCDKDLTKAYNQAMNLTCNAANNFPELSGRTLTPGVYCSGSSMKISASTVTLDANGEDHPQWVFQVATTLTTATTTSFILKNGAKAENVFWALGTSAAIGYSSSFVGNVLAQTQVSVGSSAIINGRALAFTAIVFESGSDVYLPSDTVQGASPRTAVKMSTRTSADAPAFDIGNCTRFAVNAGTSVNFDGDVTKITGLAGVSPSTAIQGKFEFSDPKFSELQKNTDLAKGCARNTRALFNKAMNSNCQADHTIQGGDLAGIILTPGVYCSSTGAFTFSAATIRLDAGGHKDAKWIFQTSTTLTTATATSFELLNGAQSKNVFWAVGTSASLGYSSNFVGTILSGAAITVETSAVVDGRALAMTAVTFSNSGVIIVPSV